MAHPRFALLKQGLELVDRYRWWISAILSALVVFWIGTADKGRWSTWLIAGLYVLLLWIPFVVRLRLGPIRKGDGTDDPR